MARAVGVTAPDLSYELVHVVVPAHDEEELLPACRATGCSPSSGSRRRATPWSSGRSAPSDAVSTRTCGARGTSGTGPGRGTPTSTGPTSASASTRTCRSGGFPAVPLHEDVLLVEAVRRSGLPWCATDTTRVTTSSRHSGRLTAGFADYLDGLGDPAATP